MFCSFSVRAIVCIVQWINSNEVVHNFPKKKENEENYESRVFYSLKSGRFNNDLLVFYPNIMTQEISDIS